MTHLGKGNDAVSYFVYEYVMRMCVAINEIVVRA